MIYSWVTSGTGPQLVLMALSQHDTVNHTE